MPRASPYRLRQHLTTPRRATPNRERIRAAPVEQTLRRVLIGQRQRVRPDRAKRQHRLLGVGQPEARGQARRVLMHEHGKRREPSRGAGGQALRPLDLDQPLEPVETRRAAENSGEQPIIEESLDCGRSAGATSRRHSSALIRSAESCASPSRSLTEAASPSAS